MIYYLIILLPVIAGLFIYLFSNKLKFYIISLTQFVLLGICIYSFFYGPDLFISLGGWDAPIGIMLNIDSISKTMVLLTVLLFSAFLYYSFHRHYADKLFSMLILMLQGLICGLFLVDDLFSIFILSELSTIVVSLLIMYKKDSRAIYDGLVYMLINIFSMTFYLLGLAMLYKELGTFSLSIIKENINSIENIRALYLPFALILTSVSLKSALMPLFSWLPKAHGTPSAPSVVSGVLSGLYVKGGVYLFIRITQAFSVIDVSIFFLICGLITAVVGFVLAIAQTDIKLILSYSTVSQIGLIMTALNMNSEMAFYGGIYHIISHAVFKSVLFLCAGIIVQNYETRNINEIRGVGKSMPVVAFAFILAILGITGTPLFNGSISKYLITKGSSYFVIELMLMLINLGTLVCYLKISRVFKKDNTERRFMIPFNRKVVLIVLGIICLFGGIFGGNIINYIFSVSFHIELDDYLIKSGIYILTLIVAFVLNKVNISDAKIFNKIKSVDLGFNGIALSVPVFFSVLLGYLIIF